jgi:hypothetical protein
MIEADELINFIRPFVGRKKQIGLTTRLYQDLRIMGDDADELFISIMERFGTSFAGINLSAYFPGEYAAGYLYLASLFGMPDRKRRSLTVQHLLAVINRGEWFDPLD